MPPLNRNLQTSRWRRREEFVPTPPAPHARLPVPEPEPAIAPYESWYDDPEPTPELPAERGYITNSSRERLLSGLGTQSRVVSVEFDESTMSIRNRSVERPPGYWKLRNGKFISIREMDSEHLENCIRMCERNSQARGRGIDPRAPGVYSELREEKSRRDGMAQYREAHRAQFLMLERVQLENNQRESQQRLRMEASRAAVQMEEARQELLFREEQAPNVIPEGIPKRRIKS